MPGIRDETPQKDIVQLNITKELHVGMKIVLLINKKYLSWHLVVAWLVTPDDSLALEAELQPMSAEVS